MSWYLKYRHDPWPDKLRRRFNRHYGSWFNDQEEACASALHILLFEKLPSTTLKNRENLDAFVNNALKWVALDLKRKLRGRAYYPAEIEQHGEPVVSIYEAYCFEAKRASAIAAELCLVPAFVHACIRRINDRKWCRERQVYVSLDNDDLTDAGIDGRLVSPEEQTKQFESLDAQRIHILIEWWRKGQQNTRALAATMGPVLTGKLKSNPPPSISDQDRTMLRLLLIEGKTHKETGIQLSLAPATVGDRKIALIKRFREYLTELGLIEQ